MIPFVIHIKMNEVAGHRWTARGLSREINNVVQVNCHTANRQVEIEHHIHYRVDRNLIAGHFGHKGSPQLCTKTACTKTACTQLTTVAKMSCKSVPFLFCHIRMYCMLCSRSICPLHQLSTQQCQTEQVTLCWRGWSLLGVEVLQIKLTLCQGVWNVQSDITD